MVDLEVFQGPMDVLLHLVRQEKVSVYDIPIARLAEQFLAYLERVPLESFELERAANFLVMAATLMYLKARELVPRPSRPAGDGEDLELDPALAFRRRLAEYQRFKDAAGYLQDLWQEARKYYWGGYLDGSGRLPDVWARLKALVAWARNQVENQAGELERQGMAVAGPVEPPADERLPAVPVTLLAEAWQRCLKRLSLRPQVVALQPQPVSLRRRLLEIWRRIRREGHVTFAQLVEGQHHRLQVVVTFLALLELIRMERVWAWQEDSYGELYLAARPHKTGAGQGAKRGIPPAEAGKRSE